MSHRPESTPEVVLITAGTAVNLTPIISHEAHISRQQSLFAVDVSFVPMQCPAAIQIG